MSRDLAPVLPHQVKVVFPNRRCSTTGVDTDPAPFYEALVDLEDVTLTDGAALNPGTSAFPGVKVFHDGALGVHVAAVAPANSAALDALARRVAQDYYDWLTQGFDTVYFGVCAPEPNGLFDLITWGYDAECVTTRVTSAPLNADPEELHHLDPAIAGCVNLTNVGVPYAATPGVEYYGPPASCTSGGAAATCALAGDAVGAITVTDQGSGYITAPDVQFSAGDGTGAIATAILTGDKVTSVNVVAGGSGYTRPPVVSFSGGGKKLQVTRYVLYLEDGRFRSLFVSTDCLG